MWAVLIYRRRAATIGALPGHVIVMFRAKSSIFPSDREAAGDGATDWALELFSSVDFKPMQVLTSESTHALTPMQQGMLFHSLYAPESGVNIQQIIGTLRHPLNAAAFERAWKKIIARHEVLRTAFRWEGLDKPVQEVFAEVKLPFDAQDWRGSSSELCAQRLEEFLATDRRRGFALSEAPLMRVTLFRIDDDEYQFVWTFHHAILDGRSFGTVLKEVFAIYDAEKNGTELKLNEPKPFREFVEWSKRKDFSASKEFWREQLKGFRSPTPLVFEKPSSEAKPAVGYGEESVTLAKETTDALRQLAEAHRLGMSGVVQGAWALLLSRYSGEEDVVFGVTRACSRSSISGAEDMVGIFINTLPLRAHVSADTPAVEWLKQLRAQQNQMREHEHTPLLEIQKWSDVSSGGQLFDSILVFDHQTLNTALRAQGGEWEQREFRVIDQTNFPLTLFGFAERELLLKVEFDPRRFSRAGITRMLGHLRSLLEGIAKNPAERLSALPLLAAEERKQILVDWNQTQAEFPRERCIHELFQAQVSRSPDATALVFEENELTWRELDERANKVATRLQALGVGPDVLVGICAERSLEMVVGMLGILKAGGAYVPLDPTYPRERLAHVIEDSRMPVLVTQGRLVANLPNHSAKVICLDNPSDLEVEGESPCPAHRANSENLAYVIYTSGSTGKPKGVMLMHRNVVNFFTGMDQVLEPDSRGTWLAVTSISFDISVLEILWTLTRGFKVAIQGDEDKHAAATETVTASAPKIDFSLFYFSGDEGQNPQDKYRLLLEGAKFADENGLAAVWTPERHFHAFGGLYPNPSLTSAAIAAVTRRVQIRAGSVVLPLHHPVRVAEEWAVVDNLSQGRVGLSFASGWHSSDFVFAPENYPDRKKMMFEQIETVLKLWRGEAVTCRGAEGKDVSVKIWPRPVRREVPVWITASGSPDTFRIAGEMGANVLTNLLGQSVAEVAEKIAIYRKARCEKGHAGEGHVTLMLHTFLDADMKTVREKVRGPFTEYLKTSLDLVKKASSAWSFAAFQKPGRNASAPTNVDFSQLDPADMQALLDHAFERYFETSGLFGTPQTCMKLVNELRRVGVNEVACLIDFGVEVESVLASLRHLAELNRRANQAAASRKDYSIAAQIQRHGVTHFQCTPSLARMLISDPTGATALGTLKEFLVGGEALPSALASQLKSILSGRLHNMYGPTETAIWSTTKLLTKDDADVTIGRPLANTEIYVLDKNRQPVPVGLPGELFIGGEGVARGYWNRPELTAERFIQNPVKPGSSARLYRTGDVVTYRANGEIEFLGRADHQVKLRGHRIELGEIETALNALPGVKESVVVAAEEPQSGDTRLVAYVVPGKHASNSDANQPTNEQLTQWQMIWDGAYSDGNPTPDADFNIAGWNSSYTGQPVPEAEMREWVDCTTESILVLRPQNVLEIGCGTGLLLFRIASQCKKYVGVDFSEKALNYVRSRLQNGELQHVTLMQKAADDLREIPVQSVDTVILNSVAQYFPDVEYLVRVLEGAAKAVAPGGRIFVGDVRSLPLLEAFHASIEMHQAPPEISREEFRRRVQARIEREEELVISPAFFHALKEHLPEITQVEIQLKPGRSHNEVTRFRYDVTLYIGKTAPAEFDIAWLDGAGREFAPEELREAVLKSKSGCAGISRVTNARLLAENFALKWMNGHEGPDTLGEARALVKDQKQQAVDPEDARALGNASCCAVDVIWQPDADAAGAFDLVFRRKDQPLYAVAPRCEVSRRKPWSEYANQPAQGRSDPKLIAQLRNHLKQRLPAIMVPSAFVVLEAMPLTPNGKLDRRALPAPNTARVESIEAFVAPRTPVEKALATIWREVLGLETLGAEDDFFKLGGHSLLATQMVSRLREAFKIELPLRALFEAPTIAKLSKQLIARESRAGIIEKTARILNQLEEMSPAELEEALKNRQGAKASPTRAELVHA